MKLHHTKRDREFTRGAMGGRRSAMMLLASGIAISLLAGCSSSASEERVVIQKPDKEINVITPEKKPVEEAVEVDRIDKFEGVRGMDWLTESEIIISRENKERPPITVEGEKRYPLNLFAYDLNTGKERLLVADENNKHANFAVLSPSKAYMFYKMNIEESAYAYILNLKTGEKKQVSEELVPIRDGVWDGDDTVVFAGIPGQVFAAHPDRNTEKLLSDAGRAMNPVMSQGVLYYTDMLTLKAYQPKSGKTSTISAKVENVMPSPDGNQLAIVKMTGDTERTLVITDLKGNVKKTLSTGTQIFGVSWSPDGTKLAYNLIDEAENGVKGIVVANASTGKTTFATIDVPYASDPVAWSPSGKKLVASTFINDDKGNRVVTYVIKLK
ncbi:putative lipoprotein [Paenibacillus curdlanolyticus YK9]|uniref:Putative lipoprotein n=1 Tax=Paenibacillus curdlanolyticus YK9 TaxID=717606 RepID=E0IFK0_9BACL|nr:LpqB family beta-propeller domain-containing protein [Paenibacillus curdlanolyticus]EFM08666.1 putative lipoprotein [Paenibacillus curdlanolyticus YK9]